MCHHSTGIPFESLPLFQEVVANVVADFIDDFAVSVADLIKIWVVNHDFAAIGDGRLHLVHAFCGGPQIVIHRRHYREHAPVWLVHPLDVDLS